MRSKGQISLIFITFHFHFVFSQTYRMKFSFCRLGHAPGVVLGGAEGSKTWALGFGMLPHRLPILVVFFFVQWLSGRVLDFRLRSCWLEPHQRHCIVSFILCLHWFNPRNIPTWQQNCYWDIKHQLNQTFSQLIRTKSTSISQYGKQCRDTCSISSRFADSVKVTTMHAQL